MIDPKELAESGVLLVDKQVDWTSHDVVHFVRRRFNIRKVGHCGTLDPTATGLLVLVLGRATKISSRLTNQNKTYSGTMRLGVETDTDDRAGEVTATASTETITADDVRRVMATFTGDLMQTPPMVSAIKKGGKVLYKLARQGQTVERDPRPITIHSSSVGAINIPDVDFEVCCSKGTYVRTLCADIGRELGCGAHLLELRRLSSGRYNVAHAHSTDEMKTWEREKLLATIIPLGHVLVGLTNQQ